MRGKFVCEGSQLQGCEGLGVPADAGGETFRRHSRTVSR